MLFTVPQTFSVEISAMTRKHQLVYQRVQELKEQVLNCTNERERALERLQLSHSQHHAEVQRHGETRDQLDEARLQLAAESKRLAAAKEELASGRREDRALSQAFSDASAELKEMQKSLDVESQQHHTGSLL